MVRGPPLTAPAITFCFIDERVRPSAVAAMRSAQHENPESQLRVYCDAATRAMYSPRTRGIEYRTLADHYRALGTSRPEVAVRRMRALALVRHGGWYLDAFDTLTLARLPAPSRFTVGEECWQPGRYCSGVCASLPGDDRAAAWLARMVRMHPSDWDHWSDQRALHDVLAGHAVEALPTGRLNWPSESGFVGELRLSEEQVAWLLHEAWVIHYFGRGAFGTAYKEMDEDSLERCHELGGWLPQQILKWYRSR